MAYTVAYLLAFVGLPRLQTVSAHGHHEWVGVFDLKAGESYTWSAARGSSGKYADPSMKLVAYPVAKADKESVKAVENTVDHLWHGNWTEVANGGVLEVGATGLAAELNFNNESWLSLFYLQVAPAGTYGFFCEHEPSEFESGFHFLRDEHGHDVEPAYEEGHHHDHDDEGEGTLWFAVGGAFLTTVPAVLVVALVGTQWGVDVMRAFMPLASGAIAATAAFLIFPEAFELAGGSAGENHDQAHTDWGVSLLAGWLTCVAMHHVISIFVPGHSHSHGVEHNESSQAVSTTGSKREALNVADPEQPQSELQATNWSVALPILFGDFIHGLVDGLVIGFAAKLCNNSLTWGVIIATAGHEIPQEVGDFLILVSEAKMPWKPALAANFVASQSAVIGALIGFLMDVSARVQGISLSFCGGVFLFIAFSELAPHMLFLKSNSAKDSLCVLFTFLLGVVAISFFIGHAHCSGGHDHGHGHGHGHHHDH